MPLLRNFKSINMAMKLGDNIVHLKLLLLRFARWDDDVI